MVPETGIEPASSLLQVRCSANVSYPGMSDRQEMRSGAPTKRAYMAARTMTGVEPAITEYSSACRSRSRRDSNPHPDAWKAPAQPIELLLRVAVGCQPVSSKVVGGWPLYTTCPQQDSNLRLPVKSRKLNHLSYEGIQCPQQIERPGVEPGLTRLSIRYLWTSRPVGDVLHCCTFALTVQLGGGRRS